MPVTFIYIQMTGEIAVDCHMNKNAFVDRMYVLLASTIVERYHPCHHKSHLHDCNQECRRSIDRAHNPIHPDRKSGDGAGIHAHDDDSQ